MNENGRIRSSLPVVGFLSDELDDEGEEDGGEAGHRRRNAYQMDSAWQLSA